MNNIEKLIELNVEIEGLLMVIKERESDTALRVLAEKYTEFKNLVEELLGAENDRIADTATASAQTDGDVMSLEEAIPLALDYQPSVAEQHENVLSEEEPAVEEEPAEAESAIEEVEVEAEHDAEQTILLDEEPVTAQIDEEEPEAEDAASEDEAIAEPAEDPAEESAEEVKDEPKAVVEEDDDEEPVAPRGEEIRVDELLSRREARDLKRAFTLNDKFRFRRELFGHNDILFGQTLDTISEMANIEEAESYLYGHLGLDPENEDVKDFVMIVKNHFASI
jgi:hypothetical protein